MKRMISALAAILFAISAFAQDPDASGTLYLTRYKLLVSNVGDCGVGVNGFLDKWEAAMPTDVNMMLGRFNYFLAKCVRDTLIKKDAKTYLGKKPVLSLKDSTGKKVNYFTETLYDEALFAEGLKWIEKAITTDNARMELMVAKANALVQYEKESPDMSAQYLCGVIDSFFKGKATWTFYGKEVNSELFCSTIQDYCYSFYMTGSKASYEAFRTISETMLKYQSSSLLFLDNLGSYYLVVQKNYSKAKKYYSKALKLDPNDKTAQKNMEILLRVSKKK